MKRLLLAAASAATVSLCLATASAGGGVQPTRMSLPKGPGSIEGLGKNFVPSLASGTASYGFDIAVPPGSNGFQPSLSLDYDSGGGVTELGMGFRLGGVPALRRRVENGLPRFDASDVFELVGMGIPCDLLEISPGTFRPQYESGAFVRVQRAADGKSWEARDKSGFTYRFGGDGFTEAEGDYVATYLLREQRDLHGHVISYAWDTSSGHALLTKVTYNDFNPEARNEVLFDYETRTDVHTFFNLGIKQTIGKRLKSVIVQHGGALVRRYDIGYGTSAHSRIASVTLTGRDGVSKLPSATLQYAEATFATDGQIVVMKTPPGRSPADPNVDLADLNGDGLPDLLVTKAGAFRSYLNHDGTSWKAGVDWAPSDSPSLELASVGVQLADVDADGALDLLAKSGTSSFRYLPGKSDTAFGAAVTLGHAPNFSFEDPDTRLADMDGDRRADVLITAASGDLYVGYNVGGKDWAEPLDVGAVDPKQPLRFSDGGHTQLCDLNGDRVEDFCYLRSESLAYWLGRGRGKFEAPVTATGVPSWDPSSPWELHDLDGDGWVDLVHVGVSQVDVRLASAAGVFGDTKTIAKTPTKGPATTVRFADMNGSGTTDIVWIDVSSSADGAWQYLEVFPQGRAGLLTKVDNGYGKTLSITYGTASHDAAVARDASAPWATRMNIAMPVVAKVAIDDGLGDPSIVTTYLYKDGTFSPRERTFVGFGGGIETQLGDEHTPTLVNESTFDVGLDFRELRGVVLSSESRDTSGTIFSRSLDSYVRRFLETAADGRKVEYAFKSAERVLHVEGTDLAKARTTLTEWDHDNLGNVISEKTWGEVVGDDKLAGNDEAITIRTFANNTTDWIFGRIAGEELQDAKGARLRLTRHYYDGDAFVGLPLGQVGRGNLTRSEAWVGPEGEKFEMVDGSKFDADGHVVDMVDARGAHRRFGWSASDHTTITTESVETGTQTLTALASFDSAFGLITSFTAYNGAVSTFDYDAFGRIASVVRPGDTSELPTQRFRYLDGAPISRTIAEARIHSGRPEVETSEVILDGLARHRAVLVTDAGDRWVMRDNGVLDARGNTWRHFQPRFLDAAGHDAPPLSADGPASITTNDAIGREVATRSQLGIVTKTAYAPLSTLHWDGGQATDGSPYEHTPNTSLHDGLNRLVSATWVVGGKPVSALYAYDASGSLLSQTDPEGNVARYVYDGRGRRLVVDDPDAGKHSFVYDQTGNLVEHHKPGGAVVRYVFDLPGRPVAEDWNGDGVADVARTYDVNPAGGDAKDFLGKLASVQAPSGLMTLTYDARQRITAVEQTFEGKPFRSTTSYDAQDRDILHGFPDGSSIAMHRDLRGIVTSYGQALTIDYDADGQETKRTFNTGVATLFGYDADRRRTDARATAASGDVIHYLRWNLDPAGRIASVEDHRPGIAAEKERSEKYAYDNLYRLVSVEGAWGKASWAYSASSNVVQRTSSVSALDAGALKYGEGAGPHAPTTVKGRVLRYDVQGRLLDDGERSFTYDDADHLVGVKTKGGASVESVFDDTSRRIAREHGSDGTDHVTYFLDTWSEVRDGQLVRYLVHGDRRIARLASATGQTQAALAADTEGTKAEEPPAAHAARLRVLSMNAGWFFVSLALIAALGARYRRQLEVALPAVIAALALSVGACGHGGGPPPPPDVPDGTILTLSEDDEILLDDVVGSVNEQVSGSGKVRGEFAAYPYGLARYDSTSIERKFANTPRDVGVGLDMMGARAYAADIGAWTRPDPLRIEQPEALVGRGLPAANAYLYGDADPVSRSDATGFVAAAPAAVLGVGATAMITLGATALVVWGVHEAAEAHSAAAAPSFESLSRDLVLSIGTAASDVVLWAKKKDEQKVTPPKLGQPGGPKVGSKGGKGRGKAFDGKTKGEGYEESDGRCVFCGVKTKQGGKSTPRKSEGDHAIPKSRGGNNTIDNLQNTCRTCNRRKGRMTTEEFIDSGKIGTGGWGGKNK